MAAFTCVMNRSKQEGTWNKECITQWRARNKTLLGWRNQGWNGRGGKQFAPNLSRESQAK